MELKQLQITLDNEREAKLQAVSQIEELKHQYPFDMAIDIPSNTENNETGIIYILHNTLVIDSILDNLQMITQWIQRFIRNPKYVIIIN